MSDLIDRQKAINAMQKYDFFILSDMRGGFISKLRDAIKADLIDAVRELPTVETERDGGYWEWSDDEYETRVCSECEFDTRDYVEYPFCPNCGVLMSDLIDRQEAEQRIDDALKRVFVDSTGLGKKILARITSIEPKQKTGTWVKSEGSDDWYCSECKFKMPWKYQKTPYCPNCGAKMKNTMAWTDLWYAIREGKTFL